MKIIGLLITAFTTCLAAWIAQREPVGGMLVAFAGGMVGASVYQS